MSSDLGLRPRAVRAELRSIGSLSLPCIVHWNFNHFVVVESLDNKKVTVLDPAVGRITHNIEAFSKQYTGIAVELFPLNNFLVDEWSAGATGGVDSAERKLLNTRNAKPIITFIGLTLLLLVFSLIAPLMIQIVVDDVLVKNDTDLLGYIIGIFLISNLLSVLVSYLHSIHIQKFSSLYRIDYVYEYVDRLLKFPLNYFYNRNLGYFIAQYSSLDHLVSFVVKNFGELVTDILFILAVSALLLFVDHRIFVVIALANCAVIAMRFSVINIHRRYVDDDIRDRSIEEGYFVETVRGVSSVKSNLMSTVRAAKGVDNTIKAVNTHLKLTIFLHRYDAIVSAIKSIELAVVIYLLAGRVLSAEMTVGVMYAFHSYRLILDQRVTGFLGNVASALTLKVHKNRVYEVIDSDDSMLEKKDIGSFMVCSGNIMLQDVSYSIDSGRLGVINSYSNSVDKGDFVVVSGPTGCGKSTLLKLMLNTLDADSGSIFYDSMEITNKNSSVIKSSVGVVLQEDILFSGSILENIASFDESINFERVVECAELCEIGKEIGGFPLKYQSLVGDMGANISSGQTQRILLARALYKNPPILFLDEATANLNSEVEKKILENLRGLGKTIIFATHSEHVKKHGNKIWEL